VLLTMIGGSVREVTLAQRGGGSSTGVITGRAVVAGEDTPIRGVEVQARGNGGLRSTFTDGDGRFELPNVSAGLWNVTASKPGFVARAAGQRSARPLATPVRHPGSGRVSVDFALMRGGVITGTLFDRYGDPVAGAAVEALRPRFVQGRRQFAPAGSRDRSDDNGTFRIHSLPPGDYYVAATLPVAAPDEAGVRLVVDVPGRGTGLPTYYPGTPRAADAERLTLGPGEERSSVTFAVAPARAVRVSGLVIDSTGAAVEGADLDLLNAADGSVAARAFGNFGQTHPGGRFAMINVSPGDYVLAAKVTRPGGEMEMGFTPIAVGAGDLADVAVTTHAGATLSGVVVAAEGTAPPATWRVAITARPTSLAGELRRTTSNRDTDAFSLRGLFGPLALLVDDLPDGWIMDAITLNGRDVTDRPFDFPPGARLSARVVLRDGAAEVRGVVESSGGPLPAQVVVFPADAGRWTFPSRFVRAVQADRQGRFRVASLPPDRDYLAIALDFVDGDEFQDPEFLEHFRRRATPFSTAAGATRTLELTLVGR
jgi:hypothetical protein